MNKKLLTAILSLLVIGNLVANPVLAETEEATSSTRGLMQKNKVKLSGTPGLRKTQAQGVIFDKMKARTLQELTRRINALNKVLGKISGLKRLTADQKSTLTSQVNTEITALTNLKTKIEGDTDIATLETDKKSIINEYRVFALFIPKIHILAVADSILNIVDNVTNNWLPKLKERAIGVAGADAILADMETNLNDAKTQAQGAIDAVMPLTPSGYPGNKETLKSARDMLVKARQDLAKVRHDVGQLGGMKGLKPTRTVTSVLTPTP